MSEKAANRVTIQVGALTAFRGPQGERGERGEKGPPGPKGDKGDPGKDGNMVGVRLDGGVFAMHVGEDGHLYMMHNDGDPEPPLSIDESGHLVYTIR